MTDANELPPYAVLVQHTVADWDQWKAGFDGHESARAEAGMLGHHLNRGRDNPNEIGIYLAISDLDAAKAFSSSPELKEVMENVGVVSPPEFLWMRPARESVQWEGEHPAFVITHQVEDFDTWLEAYDGAGEMQQAGGIIGHAASQSLDDPSVAVVYHQADSFETLETFLANPDLQAAMKDAGVISEPEVSFHTGGHAKLY